MAHSNKTFKLDQNWDIVTEGGAFSLLHRENAIAQNVANEIKLFTNDAWIAKNEGNPWFDIQFSKPVRRLATSAALRRSALRVEQVERVESINVKSFDIRSRTLHAEIILTSGGKSFALNV